MGNKNNKPLIVGITGAFGSGKSSAAEFFAAKGFTCITLSSFLEEEATKRGIFVITRKILQDIGNEWRIRYGNGILAQRAIEYINKQDLKDIVVDGVRNLGEIDVLRAKGDFTLLAIVANRAIRFSRLQKLKRREHLTQEVFYSLDMRDLGIGEENTGLQVAFCMALADIYFDNNGTKEVFEANLNKILVTIKKKV